MSGLQGCQALATRRDRSERRIKRLSIFATMLLLGLVVTALLWLASPAIVIVLIRRGRRLNPMSEKVSRALSLIFIPLFILSAIDIGLFIWTKYSFRGYWTDFIVLVLTFGIAFALASVSAWRKHPTSWIFLFSAFLLAFQLPAYTYNRFATDIEYKNNELRVESGGRWFIQRAGSRLIVKSGLTEYDSIGIGYYPNSKIRTADLKNDSLHLVMDCKYDPPVDTMISLTQYGE